jgi:hypothetical protein
MSKENLGFKVDFFKYFIGYAILSFLNLYFSWPLLQGNEGEPANFPDLDSVLNSVQIFISTGDEVFKYNSDLPGSGYMYGSTLLLLLQFLGASPTITNILGYFFICLTVLMVSICMSGIQNKSFALIAFGVLISYSPFFWLLQQRGNIDTLIFALVFLAIFVLSRNLILLYYILILFISLLKFYTLPLLVIPFICGKKFLKLRILKAAIVIILFIFTLIQIVLDLGKIANFPSGWQNSYGAPNYAYWLNQLSEYFLLKFQFNPQMVQGIVVSITLFGGYYLYRTKIFTRSIHLSFKKESKVNDFRELLFVSFLFLFLISFLAGSNFDYRMFTLLIATTIARPFVITSQRSLFFLYVLGAFTFWLTALGSTLPLLQLAGDSLANMWAFLATALLLFVFKNNVMNKNRNQFPFLRD